MVTAYHGPNNLSKAIDRLRVKFVGGRPCLDFVNTVGGRGPTGAALRDKLANYEDVLGWSVLAGLLDNRQASTLDRLAAREAGEAAEVMGRTISLREALYRILRSALEGGRTPGKDASILRRELDVARAHQYLAAQEGRFAWRFVESPAALERVLWPVALSAAELLTSSDLARLRQCGGQDCGWLFLDNSRNHRRQWCDMQDCGNRAKVRRFREKVRRVG